MIQDRHGASAVEKDNRVLTRLNCLVAVRSVRLLSVGLFHPPANLVARHRSADGAAHCEANPERLFAAWFHEIEATNGPLLKRPAR